MSNYIDPNSCPHKHLIPHHQIPIINAQQQKLSLKKFQDPGTCKSCKEVIYKCKGCYRVTTLSDGYRWGDQEQYSSYYCSRGCFERNH